VRGRGPQPWPSRHRRVAALVVGFVVAMIILAVLAWVIGTWPRPGWRDPVPAVPTAPAPRP
jgi:hypothetical protein